MMDSRGSDHKQLEELYAEIVQEHEQIEKIMAQIDDTFNDFSTTEKENISRIVYNTGKTQELSKDEMEALAKTLVKVRFENQFDDLLNELTHKIASTKEKANQAQRLIDELTNSQD